MYKTIVIDESDKELLLEIADWISVHGSKDDPILRESAKRIVYHLSNDQLEFQIRYVDYLRRAFPDFWTAFPEKKKDAEELRIKLSQMINSQQ